MSGVSIIRSILVSDGNLLNVVPETKIMAGVIPLNTALPAISIRQISGLEYKTISRTGTQTVTERIQVSVLAPTYMKQKEILELIRSAIPATRGTVNTFDVDSIVLDIDGPDLYTETPVIYEQSIDYMVRFNR